MLEKAQLMKGILESCILKIIQKSETYGYEIAQQLQQYGFQDVKEGTLYPLLLRLEKKALIEAVYMPSPLGPKRKYYHLTETGEEYLKGFYDTWKEVADSVRRIFEEDAI